MRWLYARVPLRYQWRAQTNDWEFEVLDCIVSGGVNAAYQDNRPIVEVWFDGGGKVSRVKVSRAS